jgi:hypothetical protein
MKVRVIHQRYGGLDDAATDKLTGEPVSLYDVPLVNSHTGKPLVNGGSFAYKEAATGKIRNWQPGEVLEMPDEEALAQIAMTPLVLERESDYQARMERIARRHIVHEAARYELEATLQQSNQSTSASQRMAAMIAERDQAKLREAAAALRAPDEAKDKKIEELEAKVNQLLEALTRPAGQPEKA